MTVSLLATPALLQLAQDVLQRQKSLNLSDDVVAVLAKLQSSDASTAATPTVASLPLTVVRLLQQHSAPRIPLHQLLHGSEIVVAPPPARVRNPELVERLKRLQVEQENRDYQRMVKTVAFADHEIAPSVKTELRNAQETISGAFGMLFTAISAFAAVFYVSTFVYDNMAVQVLLGLGAAFLVLFAELWFFIRNDW